MATLFLLAAPAGTGSGADTVRLGSFGKTRERAGLVELNQRSLLTLKRLPLICPARSRASACSAELRVSAT